VIKMANIKVFTMIDNVGICSDNPSAFCQAVKLFLSRCALVGATLNDSEKIPKTSEGILEAGLVRPQTFLGEVYLGGGLVANSDANISKLHKAYTRLQSAIEPDGELVTKRQLCALIGLWTWMAHTVEVPLRNHFDAIRLHSTVSASSTHWDDPIRITPHMLSALGEAIFPLLSGRRVKPTPPPQLSWNNSDYVATLIVDASATGYGAIVLSAGTIYQVKGGWRRVIPHSAWAEPLGATELIKWIRTHTSGRLAIVTDHNALAAAQRRPRTGNGGFSKAYYLNNFFKELYSDNLDHQVFYVQGESNPADYASRTNKLGDPLSATVLRDTTFPSLRSFAHPHEVPPLHRWWFA
ncbi:MAG: hypothetical protein Q7T55_17320, partial [Solirubrobacteraceae bacterium]|nr:hypothetical protein [Solirubrobacteraceae bacterium]